MPHRYVARVGRMRMQKQKQKQMGDSECQVWSYGVGAKGACVDSVVGGVG